MILRPLKDEFLERNKERCRSSSSSSEMLELARGPESFIGSFATNAAPLAQLRTATLRGLTVYPSA